MYEVKMLMRGYNKTTKYKSIEYYFGQMPELFRTEYINISYKHTH